MYRTIRNFCGNVLYRRARKKVSAAAARARGFRLFLRSIKSKVSGRSRRRLTQIIAAYWYRRVYAGIRVPVDRYFPPRRNFKTILTGTRKKYEVQSSNSLPEIEGGRGGPIGTPARILLFDARRIDLNAKAYLAKLPKEGRPGSANSTRIINLATFCNPAGRIREARANFSAEPIRRTAKTQRSM